MIFASEIAWSDGKVIDEVLVCNMCPDCLDDLPEKVNNVVARNQEALVERLTELVANF